MSFADLPRTGRAQNDSSRDREYWHLGYHKDLVTTVGRSLHVKTLLAHWGQYSPRLSIDPAIRWASKVKVRIGLNPAKRRSVVMAFLDGFLGRYFRSYILERRKTKLL